jgi:hypothetical protein
MLMAKKCKQCKVPIYSCQANAKGVQSSLRDEIARQVVDKAEKKETKLKLDAMQTKPQLVKKAQTAFNAYIRARDAGKPCISCDKPLDGGANTFDAGHYRSVGSAPHMRFVEDNVHGQCKHCNNWLAGNHVEYRKRLLDRIGERQLELLETDGTLRKYTKEALIEIARHYNEQARRLAKESVD